MANLRRRSARLSKTNAAQSSARKTPASNNRLGSLVERDETPDVAQQSIDEVLATPTSSRTVQSQLLQLSGLKTPQSHPKVDHIEMDPKSAHRSTAKAPDSGLKFGFSDIVMDKKNDTPSKSASRSSRPSSSTFEFKFSADSHLSQDAQKLMENVREDAARIKAQMLSERAAQEQKDREAHNMFGAGRKIAQPRGKAGRFSDVHMAQFRKMDSIENHASAFRARPGYAAPTAQSLKRSPSKAGLDEHVRPHTAGKVTQNQPRHIPPPVTGRLNSTSPFKSIPSVETRATQGSNKRARQLEHKDISDSRPSNTLPRPASSTLYSPTKSSLSRLTPTIPSSPEKRSMIPRSNSMRSIRSNAMASASSMSATVPTTIMSSSPEKPLPPIPIEETEALYPELPQSPMKSPSIHASEAKFQSKLPVFSGLKSILRGNRKQTPIADRPGTPKRPNSVVQSSASPKKVDFTPSVKSRHAVKLAVDGPSPAKVRRDTPYKTSEPIIPYDSSAWVIDDDGDDNQDWEDEDSEVAYPTLPPADESDPSSESFSTRAKEMNRRESKEFKSIFTTLHPVRSEVPTSLTTINTMVNKTNPETHVKKIVQSTGSVKTQPSPSSIRRVRNSSSAELVQPFKDISKAVAYGPFAKKRRHETLLDHDEHGSVEDTKENRRLTEMPAVPGAWEEHSSDEVESEAVTRAGKRARMSAVVEEKAVPEKSSSKRPNAAREAAAKNAKERKGRGVLSLSRLNMLSRPKSRG